MERATVFSHVVWLDVSITILPYGCGKTGATIGSSYRWEGCGWGLEQRLDDKRTLETMSSEEL